MLDGEIFGLTALKTDDVCQHDLIVCLYISVHISFKSQSFSLTNRIYPRTFQEELVRRSIKQGSIPTFAPKQITSISDVPHSCNTKHL